MLAGDIPSALTMYTYAASRKGSSKPQDSSAGPQTKRPEIDGKIAHYQRLHDQPTLDGIKQLIEIMKAQKAALHPEQR